MSRKTTGAGSVAQQVELLPAATPAILTGSRFLSWLLHYQSASPHMSLEKQEEMAQVLRPLLPCGRADGMTCSCLWPGLYLSLPTLISLSRFLSLSLPPSLPPSLSLPCVCVCVTETDRLCLSNKVILETQKQALTIDKCNKMDEPQSILKKPDRK